MALLSTAFLGFFSEKENGARLSEQLVKKEKQCSEYLEIIQYFSQQCVPKCILWHTGSRRYPEQKRFCGQNFKGTEKS